jgi:hypothetical protein
MSVGGQTAYVLGPGGTVTNGAGKTCKTSTTVGP